MVSLSYQFVVEWFVDGPDPSISHFATTAPTVPKNQN
jgi:hypothetical protein